MTPLETLPAPAVLRGPATDTGLRVPQILLTALFAAAGFNVLLGLEQQLADYFTWAGVCEWFSYLGGTIGPAYPTVAACAALGFAGAVIEAIMTHLLI